MRDMPIWAATVYLAARKAAAGGGVAPCGPEETEAKLRELYAAIPAMRCRGLCAEVACGSVAMIEHERERIQARHGVHIADGMHPQGCPALTAHGNCSVYDDRPMVCRVWGSVPMMSCPYGCQPDGGQLTDLQGAELTSATVMLDRRPPRSRQ